MFEINSKVVCVDARFPDKAKTLFNRLPVKGHIYTVRDIVPGQDWKLRATCAVLLGEIVSKPNEHGIEPGFAPWRFADIEDVKMQREDSASIGSFTSTPASYPPVVPQLPSAPVTRRAKP